MRLSVLTILLAGCLTLASCGGGPGARPGSAAPSAATAPASLAPGASPAAGAPPSPDGLVAAPRAAPSPAAHAFGKAYGKLGRRVNRLRTALSEDVVRGDAPAARRQLQRLRAALVGYQRALRATAFPPAVVPGVLVLRQGNRATIVALDGLARGPEAAVLGSRTDAVLAAGFPPLVRASQRIAEALSDPAAAGPPGG